MDTAVEDAGATTFDRADKEEEECTPEPELPRPSTVVTQRRPSTLGRKRTIDESLFSDSSDLPIFSSDDGSAGLENYLVLRRKRVYRGTWWDRVEERPVQRKKPAASPPRKRRLTRNMDSGVWMNSDSTSSSDEILRCVPAVQGGDDDDRGRNDNDGERSRHDQSPMATDPPSNSGSSARTDGAQEEAFMVVQGCVDKGIEDVDLSDRYLGDIPGSTLRPLHQLILPPGDIVYNSLEPSLRLYLANNALSRLPAELYRLADLTMLSLRQNDLTEIMPAVANLTRLKKLNVSSNLLGWLPWEILQQPRISIMTQGNPFFEPVNRRGGSLAPDQLEASFHPVHDPVFRAATTAIAYLDIDGLPCRWSPPAPSAARQDYQPPERTSTPHAMTGSERRVPSLLECTLRACTRSTLLEQLPDHLPDDAPPSLPRLLRHAAYLKEAGGQVCSVCSRGYIVPRTEWMEWWSGIDGPYPIPLLRRGCSWKCVPDLEHADAEWRGCGWKAPQYGR